MELLRVEEEEFVALEKKHGIEIKRMNSNLRWGRYQCFLRTSLMGLET